LNVKQELLLKHAVKTADRAAPQIARSEMAKFVNNTIKTSA
jgi:hypothetical protein